MTSYNRHGAVAASANVATMVNILQGEWGFHGYNVTDFTGVSLKAAPKESLMAGTTNFCGFGASVDYWNAEALSGDRAMLLAIKNDIHNALYALANSAMLNGVKSTTVVSTVEVMTPWRVAYTACEYAFGALAALSLVFWVVSKATFQGRQKGMKKTSIFATVTALAALVIYLLTSLTGFMAGKAMNIWPVVLTVAAIVLLFAADKMKKPSALKDIVIVLTGFALIGCISFFAMDRVKLAADVWFIPVNRPATEDVALYCSLAGVALYLISFVTVTVKAFSHKE